MKKESPASEEDIFSDSKIKRVFRTLESLNSMENREEEEPEDIYGTKLSFVKSFVTREMEEAFVQIALSFLQKEPRIREKPALFQELLIPLNKDISFRSPFVFTVLSMMLECALDGSRYASELLTELYKVYYKQEYNRVKKIRYLGIDTYSDLFFDDLREDEMDYRGARVTIMCKLLHIEISPNWNFSYHLFNEHEEHDRLVWRTIEAAYFDERVKKRRRKARSISVDWLAENYPEMASEELYLEDARYDYLERIERTVVHELEKYHLSDNLLEVFPFDLYRNAIEGTRWFYTDIERENPSLNEILAISYIRYLSDVISLLYRERERELFQILGVSRRELVPDENVVNDWISEGMMKQLREKETVIIPEDDRREKLLRKLRNLRPEPTEKAYPDQKAAALPAEKSGSDAQAREAAGLSETVEECRAKLNEAQNREAVLRTLYEESREREKALEGVIERQKSEHTELLELRERLRRLENPEYDASEEKRIASQEEMLQVLKEKHCAVVGGTDGWVNKLKALFPDWIYASAGDSLTLDRTIGSAEAAFLYTEYLSHKMYYKMMATFRSRSIPVFFIHSTNMDRVIRSMYESLIGKDSFLGTDSSLSTEGE